MEVQFHAFVRSALVGGEWSDPRPGHIIAGERAKWTLSDVELQFLVIQPLAQSL